MSAFTPLRSASATATTSTSRTLCQSLLSRQSTTSTSRSFTTSSALQTKTIQPSKLPRHVIPPYPYGERRVYKQSNKGLYGNARIQFGNNVSEKHNVKTQRFWRPNVHVKVYYSPSLGAKIKTRLTMRVLKTIKRDGGLENYLLKSKPARIKELGPGGWKLRWLLMQTRAVQERFNEERRALGMEPREVEDRDDLVQYALDHATPGDLSIRSQETLVELRMRQLEETFILGEEALADLQDVEELTDEMEEQLLKAESEQEEINATTEKEGLRV